MAKITWTAWILFFVGMPYAFAEHHSGAAFFRYLGFGWGRGYHEWCAPTTWYGASCGCCQDFGYFESESAMAPYDGSMLNPAHHAAMRYYIPPVTYQPYVAPMQTRTAKVPTSPQLAKPSMLQSR